MKDFKGQERDLLAGATLEPRTLILVFSDSMFTSVYLISFQSWSTQERSRPATPHTHTHTPTPSNSISPSLWPSSRIDSQTSFATGTCTP